MTGFDLAKVPRDLDAVLELYDGLPAVAVVEMFGEWRGTELPTGHPLDGLLELLGWYGKRFRSADDVDPLLFTRRDGRVFAVSPGRVPLGLVQQVVRRFPSAAQLPGLARGLARSFSLARPLLATGKPGARLRMTEYRGVVSATMCYDALPVHDAFRRADDDTVLGAMDLRGVDRPFMFALTRVRGVR